jgi:protein-S-isoprenylcysteine O-methyltransferase Ste14
VNAAHRKWWQVFEIVAGLPVLVSVALQLAVPLSFPGGPLAPLRAAAGASLLVVAVALVVLARRELARHGQPTDPGQPTGRIVSTGVFAISRNPLYLGGLGAVAGVALGFDLPWVLAALPVALLATRVVLIAPEEAYLEERFGEEYRAYRRRVGRWFGRRADPQRSR